MTEKPAQASGRSHLLKGPLGTQRLPPTLSLPSPLQLCQCAHTTEESTRGEDLGDGLGGERRSEGSQLRALPA